ncbi:major facilitator superfamily transporter [Ceratobasidium sp. AG-Ba]|nr:major facilitator superfamily transporter [Ceratobasidium sp. AG-Ba]
MFSFGLSKTFWGLVFTRALAGALNGNAGVVKSMITELTDETNQAQCFAYLPLTSSFGFTFGPFIGGMLSNPARFYPVLFDTPFWREYPYFLPCLVSAIFTGLTFTISALFLKETHHPCVVSRSNASGDAAEYGAVDLPAQPQPRNLPLRSVLTKRACIAILNYALLALSDIAYAGIVPVMFAAPVQNGGLGLSPRSIGKVLGIQGLVTGVFQVFCFAPIHRQLGSKRTFIIGLVAYMGVVLSLPIMNAFARWGVWWAVWLTMGANIGMTCPAVMAFGCISMFITSAAPSKSSLGTLNGISQTTISICRAFGPAAATCLFALSTEQNLLGGWLYMRYLAVLTPGG